MDAAQKIEIWCDKGPAQQGAASAVAAAIGHRLGRWSVTVHERHAGHCWDIRVHPPIGPERHCVLLGESRSAGHVRQAVQDALAAIPALQDPEAPSRPPHGQRTTVPPA
jgi:hypothetical protein